MSALTWEPFEGDIRPTYGPPCPGPEIHRWTLVIDGGSVSVGSGCPDCDSWLDPDDGPLAFEATGRLRLDEEHPAGECPNWLAGPCDHSWSWRFVPTLWEDARHGR